MRSFLHILSCVLALAAPGSAQDPVGVVELELTGPVETIGIDAGFERTDLSLGLLSGETRRLWSPFLSRARMGSGEPTPRITDPDEARRARVVPGTVVRPIEWAELPVSLKSRGLPALRTVRPEVGALRFAWILAAALLVLGLRRRPAMAALLGVAAGLAVTWIPAAPVEQPVVRVLEGDLRSGRWLQVRGSRERLQLGEPSAGWVRHLPQAADLHLELRESASGVTWSICSPKSRIYFMEEVSIPSTPGLQGPGGHAFGEVWLREPGAAWSPRGPWAGEERLPDELEGAPGPPGWLVAGLPQGVPILAGRLTAEAGEETWLRLVGFL
jgi:hypothetical protein